MKQKGDPICFVVNQLRRLNLRVQISIAMSASSPAVLVETVTAISEGAATFFDTPTIWAGRYSIRIFHYIHT